MTLMIAFFNKPTTDSDLYLGKEVLVASVHGGLNFGHVSNYKIVTITSFHIEDGIQLYTCNNGGEYTASEMTLFSYNVNTETAHLEFKEGDIVHITDVPPIVNGKANPIYGRYGVVVNSQPNDVDVQIDCVTDRHGMGFMPESLTKVKASDLIGSDGLDAITVIRNAVKWFDYRNETLNGDKTINHLINEYVAALKYGA